MISNATRNFNPLPIERRFSGRSLSVVQNGEVSKSSIPLEISDRRDRLTNSLSPTEFFIELTKFIAHEDRNNWGKLAGEMVPSQLGVGTIKLKRSATRDDVITLARAIHQSIRPLDFFSRLSERGFWIVFHGNEQGCKRALERVEERYLSQVAEEIRKVEKFSLKARLVMRSPGEPRNAWVERIDRSYFF